MGGTGTASALIMRADVVILFPLKALAGSKMELAAAVCTEQQAGEESLAVSLGHTALVLPKLLHTIPLRLRNDGLLRVRENDHIFRLVRDPLLELIGPGIGLEAASAARVLLTLQYIHDRLLSPMIGALRKRLSFPCRIQGLGSRNVIILQDPGDTIRPFPVDR